MKRNKKDNLILHEALYSRTKENKELIKRTEQILFLGDILINYGDFSENGHPLVPLGYCEEWWLRELENKSEELFGSINYEKISRLLNINEEKIRTLFEDIFNTKLSFFEACLFSRNMSLPLYPKFLYFYSALTKEDLFYLIESLSKVKLS